VRNEFGFTIGNAAMTKLDPNRLALAALTACLVKTIGEGDAGFTQRFEQNLEKAYGELQTTEPQNTGAMEALRWTGEFLKEL
jgi:hypothetical protein